MIPAWVYRSTYYEYLKFQSVFYSLPSLLSPPLPLSLLLLFPQVNFSFARITFLAFCTRFCPLFPSLLHLYRVLSSWGEKSGAKPSWIIHQDAVKRGELNCIVEQNSLDLSLSLSLLRTVCVMYSLLFSIIVGKNKSRAVFEGFPLFPPSSLFKTGAKTWRKEKMTWLWREALFFFSGSNWCES